MTHRPQVTIKDYLAARRDPGSVSLADDLYRGLSKPASPEELAGRHGATVVQILALVRSQPKRFLERDGQIVKI